MSTSDPEALAPAPRPHSGDASDLGAAFGSVAPYPGLRPFHPEESDIFFGREELVDELLRRLGKSRFLGVVGVSGCGKSSLLRAGLIPALETGFLATAGACWTVAEMRPGTRPRRRLAETLLSVLQGPSEEDGVDHASLIEASLSSGPLGLCEVLREYEFDRSKNLLVIVDQFEELLRYWRQGDRNEADAFVASLLASARQSEFRVFVVLAMRSDYLGECAVFPGLPEALNESQFLTPRLTRDQRRAAITGPTGIFGYTIAPVAVNQILNDMGADPDQLPVMQHLLMRMWNGAARDEATKTIGLEAYRAAGGFGEALSRHVDEVFEKLDRERQRIAEVLFRCATERLDNKQDSRRPVEIREVAEVAGVPWQRVAEVVEPFRKPQNSFLLPPAGVRLEETTVIDITHETLIRQWHRLQDWVRDEATRTERFRKVEGDARKWRSRHKRRGWLLRSEALREALAWKDSARPTPAWARRYGGDLELVNDFLAQSLRRRRLLSITGFLVVTAVAFGVLWYSAHEARLKAERARLEAERANERAQLQEETTREKEKIALAYELADQSNLTRTLKLGLLETSAALAVEAARRYPSVQANQALRESVRLLPARPVTLSGGSGSALAFNRDGTELLVVDDVTFPNEAPSFASAISRFNLQTHQGGPVAIPRYARVRSFSTTGRFAAVETGNDLVVVSLETGELLKPKSRVPGSLVQEVVVSPDGKLLAFRTPTQARVVPVMGKSAPAVLPLSDPEVAAISPDARFIALRNADTDKIEIIGLERKNRLLGWNVGSARVTQIGFSPDARYVAAATDEGVVRIWDLEKGFERDRINLANYPGRVRDLVLGWHADHVALVFRDESPMQATRIFRLERGGPLREVARIEGRTFGSVAFSPDGRHVAATGSPSAGIWELSPGGEVATFTLDGTVSAVAISHDSKFVAVVSDNAGLFERLMSVPVSREISVWSVGSGQKLSSVSLKQEVPAVTFAPEAGTLFVALENGSLRRLNISVRQGPTRRPVTSRRPVEEEGAGLEEMRSGGCPSVKTRVATFSADARHVALSSVDGNVCVADLAGDGRPSLHRAAGITSLSRDAGILAQVGVDRQVRVVPLAEERSGRDGATDVMERPPLFRAQAPVLSMALSPKGSYVGVSTWKQGVNLHAIADPLHPSELAKDNIVKTFAFSDSEKLLVTGGDNGYARVWEIVSGAGARELARIAHRGAVNAVAFSSDAKHVVTASDKVVRVLRWRTEDLVDEACERLTKNLTPEEWAQYVSHATYAPTCPQLKPAIASHDAEPLLAKASRKLQEGNILEAIALYQQADEGAEKPAPVHWNELCWQGSMWGHAEQVLFACDRAVSAAQYPVERAAARDSRGVARALVGNREGAMSDFEAYVNFDGVPLPGQDRRKIWIETLRAGGNPIDPREITEFRNQ